MKHFISNILKGQVLALSLAVLGLASCADDAITGQAEQPTGDDTRTTENIDYPEAWHDKMRTMPYPKIDNELVVNPSPLIVPQSMKTKDSIQFELSQDANFGNSSTGIRPIYKTRATGASAEVIRSKFVVWNMFNPHRVLEPGTWYWRYRQKARGGEPGTWSTPIEFKVDGSTTQFVTPTFDTFLKNMPTAHPRLYAFLDAKLPDARKRITRTEGYKNMLNDADKQLDVDVEGMAYPYGQASTVKLVTQYLHTAYLLTSGMNNADLKDKNPKYKAKMLSVVRALLAKPLTDTQYYADNFVSSNIALCFIPVYDLFYNELTVDERAQIEKILYRLITHYFPWSFGYEENHIFDNHFWQQNMRVYLQCAYLLADKSAYRAKALPILEYLYEIWTARAPAMGYNRDGGWENGTKYFSDNVVTLSYVPMLLGHVTGCDFLRHPWYDKVGETMVYTWPPTSKSLGFGDGVEWYDTPTRQRVAFADFIAREKGDAFAGWYASQQIKSLRNDPDLRLYRMVNWDRTYASELPESTPKMKWLKDMGEVLVHSDLGNTDDDLSLSFRSSTFGSGSHTLADQNSFNLLYRGDYVYHNTGYYQNFCDKHNLLSYRHTRAHNTILVDGIGQPYSTAGYGNVVRAMGGDHIAYCLGDASHAYSGISDDEMWTDAFKAAGISQTAEYGFGKTPLKKYRRHLVMLYPNILVVYDELEATEPVRWDWLLHSDTQFAIDQAAGTLTTANAGKSFVAQTRLFCSDALTLAQTDKFFCDPSSGITAKYPRQWHMTASTGKCGAARVMAIVQVADDKASLLPISVNGNVYRIGNWIIEASMATAARAALTITSTTDASMRLVFDAATNTTLYDTVGGVQDTQTQTDYVPVKTRGLQ